MTNTYRIEFLPSARKSFDRIGTSEKRQLARKLVERSANPRIPGDKLSKMRDCYKIKLRSAGLRAIYQVRDNRLVLLVLAIDARDSEKAYRQAERELGKLSD